MNRVSLGIIAAAIFLSVVVLFMRPGGAPETRGVEHSARSGPAAGPGTREGARGDQGHGSRSFDGGRGGGPSRRSGAGEGPRPFASDGQEPLRDRGSGPETVVVGESAGAPVGDLAKRELPSLERPSLAGDGSTAEPSHHDEAGAAKHSATNGAKGEASGNSATKEQHTEAAPDVNPEDQAPEEDGLVLDLPLDGSEDPKHGLAPSVSDGVTFDGEGAYFAADAQLAIPRGGNIDGGGGTISFWIKPDWAGSDPINVSFIQLREPNAWSNRLQIFKNGTVVRFIFTPDEGTESGAAGDISAWQPGDWHMVTATWGDGVASLYVDGNVVGSQEYQGEFRVNPSTPLLVGSDYKPNYRTDYGAAGGAMSGVKVYNRALSPDEVFEATAGVPQ